MDVEEVSFGEFTDAMDRMTDENKERLPVETIDLGKYWLCYDGYSILGGFSIVFFPDVGYGMLCDVFSLKPGIGSLLVTQAVRLGGRVIVVEAANKFIREFYNDCGFSFVKHGTAVNGKDVDVLQYVDAY